MRIALVSFQGFQPGGISVYVEQLANRLALGGHKVHIFSAPGPVVRRAALDSVVAIHLIPTVALPLLSLVSFWTKLPGRIREVERSSGRFDVIHADTASDLTLRKRTFRQPRVVTVHHLGASVIRTAGWSRFPQIRNPAQEYGLAALPELGCILRADHLIAVSRSTQTEILRTLPRIPPGKITVIYNGVVRRQSSPRPKSLWTTRQRWGVKEHESVLLTVGRIQVRKNLSALLEAVAGLGGIEFRLFVVGGGDTTLLRQTADRLGVSERVVFTGFVDDHSLAELFDIADVYIHTSAMEGFGLSVAEAIEAGIPVVATRVGAIPEVVREGRDGFLVDYGDVPGITRAVKVILANPNAFARSAAAHSMSRFSWDRAARETLQVYYDLLAKDAPSAEGETGRV